MPLFFFDAMNMKRDISLQKSFVGHTVYFSVFMSCNFNNNSLTFFTDQTFEISYEIAFQWAKLKVEESEVPSAS